MTPISAARRPAKSGAGPPTRSLSSSPSRPVTASRSTLSCDAFPASPRRPSRTYASANIAPGTRVLSDGLACFGGVVEAGMKHTAIVTGGGRPKDERFKWTNTGLANIKGAITGTCRSCDPQHTERYLAAYEWRFNRRFELDKKGRAPRPRRRPNRAQALSIDRRDQKRSGDTGVIRFELAKALRNDGWYLRQDIIWSKGNNPMPKSVADRCTRAHEYIFLLARSEHYYFNAGAIKEPAQNWGMRDRTFYRGGTVDPKLKQHGLWGKDDEENPMRNKRSVWIVNTKPYHGAHFATFPPDLIEPCIFAGSPIGGVVLDPFLGSGTTAAVAKRLARNYIGIELNPEYVRLAEQRIGEISQEEGFVGQTTAPSGVERVKNGMSPR